MAQKIDRQQLQLYFIEALEGSKFTLIDGLNPFHIEINGKEYYIYIKNLSPAYFQNPDVWRVQLPIKEEFDEIKESDVTFILLGYDADNDVYTTWNPTWTKQRLNNAESVSFYSRLSLQQEVQRTKEFKRLTLNNDGEVVAFPREILRLFFATYGGLFQGSGDYVAMGSKKRPEANDAYKVFTDTANIPHFAKYMDEQSYSTVTINNYTRVVKTLINDGTISRSRKIFLACNNLIEYKDVIDSFTEVPEVKDKNERWHHLISAALNAYITFLTSSETGFDAEKNWSDKADLYSVITNKLNIEGFKSYLSSGKTSNGKIFNYNTINHYVRSIHFLTDEGHFERHKNIFERYDAVNDLLKAFTEFLACPEVEKMNIEAHHDHSAALKQYAYYLQMEDTDKDVLATVPSDFQQNDPTLPFLNDVLADVQYTQETEEEEDIDWEAPFIDKDGKLTKIANPQLLEKLRPYLDTEYRELAAAYNEIDLFYEKRFEAMEMSDWRKLLNNIDWSNPSENVKHAKYQTLQESQRKKKSILRVEFPNGRIIQHSVAADTFAQVIDEHCPNLIAEIKITHAGVPLVSKELDSKYADYQKPISDGWYVFTNIRTEKKQADLQRISEELGLNLKVSVVDPDDGSIVIPSDLVEGYSTSSNRAKIRVEFPDGRTIQPNKVLDALIEVVTFAGPEKVRALNIIVCGDNMITKNPRSRYVKPCKPVGNGWLCNTCSDTPTKLEQIQQISKALNLGIKASLI